MSHFLLNECPLGPANQSQNYLAHRMLMLIHLVFCEKLIPVGPQVYKQNKYSDFIFKLVLNCD